MVDLCMGHSWILVIVYLCLVHILSKTKQGDTPLFIEKKSVERDRTARHPGVSMQWLPGVESEGNLHCGEENTSVSFVFILIDSAKGGFDQKSYWLNL